MSDAPTCADIMQAPSFWLRSLAGVRLAIGSVLRGMGAILASALARAGSLPLNAARGTTSDDPLLAIFQLTRMT